MANLHAVAAAALALITLISVGVLVTAGDASAATLWSAVLPDVAVPETLRQAASPAEDAPIATRFARALTRGAVFPSMSAAFCDAAALVCDNDVQISSYGMLSPSSHHATPRASSINTINDLQFDFFLEEDLIVGKQMRLAESNLHDPIPARAFLPAVVADALPSLTTANLPKLRDAFHVADDTPMATIMGTAAFLCENPALPGEQKACPVTLPAMAQFVVSQLGEQVQALSTSAAPAKTPALVAPVTFGAPAKTSAFHPALVTIEAVTKRSLAEGDHIIICHTVMFPSALYYCHHVTGTKVVQAELRAHDASVIHAVGICHLDTSLWASQHPAFAALNIPRGAEACHWTVQNDVVWVSSQTQ